MSRIMRSRVRLAGRLGATAVLAAGCGGIAAAPAASTDSAAGSEPYAENLLQNGSFEQGRNPWYAFEGTGNPAWLPYEDAPEAAFTGKRGARLAITSADFPPGAEHGIRGALQELELPALPRRVRGHYRVESWSPSAPARLYAQIVVAATRPKNMEPAWLNRVPVQVAFALTGLDAPPFPIRNRKFLFVGPVQPVMGEWIPFEFDLHEVFREHWGGIPEGMENLRFFFEARFDGKVDPGGPPAAAVVYFDDLYLGD